MVNHLWYNKGGKINALGIAIATRQGGLPNHLPKLITSGVAQEATWKKISFAEPVKKNLSHQVDIKIAQAVGTKKAERHVLFAES